MSTSDAAASNILAVGGSPGTTPVQASASAPIQEADASFTLQGSVTMPGPAGAKGSPSPLVFAAHLRSYAEKRRRFSFGKSLKALAALASVLWVYHQYLAHIYETRVAQAEEDFSIAISQLGSDAAGIRAAGVRGVYEVAFRELPVERTYSVFGPLIDFRNWTTGRPEFPMLDRSRDLFRDFAATPHGPVNDKKSPVSTALLKTAIDWRQREHALFGTTLQDPALWLLFRARLEKAYAPGLDLTGIHFYDADLSYSTLNGAKLTGAFMQGCNLLGASLESCRLQNTNLIRADLSGARLNFANLEDAILDEAKLERADLTLVIADRARFRKAKAPGVVLRTAALRNADFSEADLKGANFSQAELRGAIFTKADLRRADFRTAAGLGDVESWEGARLEGARFPRGFKITTPRRTP